MPTPQAGDLQGRSRSVDSRLSGAVLGGEPRDQATYGHVALPATWTTTGE